MHTSEEQFLGDWFQAPDDTSKVWKVIGSRTAQCKTQLFPLKLSWVTQF